MVGRAQGTGLGTALTCLSNTQNAKGTCLAFSNIARGITQVKVIIHAQNISCDPQFTNSHLPPPSYPLTSQVKGHL